MFFLPFSPNALSSAGLPTSKRHSYPCRRFPARACVLEGTLQAVIKTVATMGPKRTKAKKKKADKPSFNEAALAQLTSRIDKSLADSEGRGPAKRKRQRDGDDGPGSKRRQTQSSDAKPDGDLGDESKGKQGRTLLDEILALGGDEDDLELVANVDSGNEGGDASHTKTSEVRIDKSFRDELAKFASSLGFDRLRKDEDPDTDDDSFDAGEDTQRSQSEEDSDMEEKGNRAATPPQEAREAGQREQPGKLVSKQRCKGRPPSSRELRLT